jgi:hypothetical protein
MVADALQGVINEFSSNPSKASLLNVNAAVVNAVRTCFQPVVNLCCRLADVGLMCVIYCCQALGKLDVEDDGLHPLAIVAVLVVLR